MNKITHKNQTKNFTEILNAIKHSKQNAYQSVNKILVELYYEVGKILSVKVENANWGRSIVKELAEFIKRNEPNMQGFSERNLWRIKQFYETYKDDTKLSTLWRELSWSANRVIMGLKTKEEREFYLLLAKQDRLSVRDLERAIKTSTFERVMIANEKLSTSVKELPQETTNVFKDSYVLEFLDLPPLHKEKDLQTALVSSLKDFILELGHGFAFIGQEYRVQVGNSDFFIDLLFYHRHLKCLVAIEIKTTPFKPADLGQLEFYLEALDQDVKTKEENPSIGILLCRQKDDEVVKYALNRSVSPTVITQYETKLIPKDILKQKLNELYLQFENKE